ncbi:MAG: hypothetical protein LBV55_02645 [Acholeplasmatales bacterium]|jgi:hypothetical protein|nr:hypothetical protein [Acholeplasmatales bacterium]
MKKLYLILLTVILSLLISSCSVKVEGEKGTETTPSTIPKFYYFISVKVSDTWDQDLYHVPVEIDVGSVGLYNSLGQWEPLYDEYEKKVLPMEDPFLDMVLGFQIVLLETPDGFSVTQNNFVHTVLYFEEILSFNLISKDNPRKIQLTIDASSVSYNLAVNWTNICFALVHVSSIEELAFPVPQEDNDQDAYINLNQMPGRTDFNRNPLRLDRSLDYQIRKILGVPDHTK